MLNAMRSRHGVSRAVGGVATWCAAVPRPFGCPGRLAASGSRVPWPTISAAKRYTISTAQANPEEVWGQIVEMFAVNGDTNYGPCSHTTFVCAAASTLPSTSAS